MKTFVLELRFDRDNERRLAVRPSHRVFLQQQHGLGRLVMAGPLADDSGAVLVFRAPSLADLEDTLRDDPYVQEDVVTRASLREWTLIIPAPE